MLRKLLMLMALLSGLTALYAPERALAAQDIASQVETAETEQGEAAKASYAEVFGPSWIVVDDASARRIADFTTFDEAPAVLVGIDRARE